MSAIYKYQLPSGATYTLTAPDGTTQDQADKIFYEQVAAGSLVGYSKGQTLSSAAVTTTKFELSRLDRGTAGTDITTVLAVIGGVSIAASVPTLINVPITNPISQANVVATASGLGPDKIGPLSALQVRAIMAQSAQQVGQAPDVITQELGVGKYGFNSMQLEMAGYLKPGTTAQFLNPNQSVAAPNPDNFVAVLGSSSVWTNVNGIDGLNSLLANENIQDQIQFTLLKNTYNSLTNAGVIQTSTTPQVSLSQGVVYSPTSTTAGTLAAATSLGAIALAASSQSGVASQIAQALSQSGINTSTSTLINAAGLSSASSAITSLSGTASALAKSISGIDATNPSSVLSTLTAANQALKITQGSVGSLLSVGSKLGTQTAAAWSQGLAGLGDKAGALVDQGITGVKGQITNIIGGVEAQGKAIIAQGKAIADNIGKMGKYAVDFANGKIDSLTSGIKQAAAFTNTVDRSTLDVAMSKIIGNSKIPTPDFSSVSALNASIQGDIKYAQNALAQTQSQIGAVLAQGQSAAGQISQTVGQVQQIAQSAQSTATGLTNQVVGSATRLL